MQEARRPDATAGPPGRRHSPATTVEEIIECAPDAVVAMDADGRISHWNRRAHELFGWAADEAVGRPVRDVLVPEPDRPAHDAGLERVLGGAEPRLLGDPVQVEALHRSGATFPVELTISRVDSGEEAGFVAFIRDVRAVRQAESDLREARDTFRLAFTASPMGIAMAAVEDFAWLEVNPAFCAMLGYTEEELRQRNFVELTHPDEHARTISNAQRLRRGDTSVVRVERRFLRKDGTTLWADVTVLLLRDASGAPRCYLGQILDITERKTAEEAVRTSERRLADAQVVGHVGSWEHDAELGQVVWSDELHRIFGLEGRPAPQTSAAFLDLVHPDDREEVDQAIREVPGAHDYRIVRPDGEIRWVHGRRRAIGGPGEPRRIAGIIQDITERKRIEEELRRSNAALEHYAHAASHDLASPLTTISGFAAVLRMRHADALPAEALSYLDAIERGTERMRAMLDAMLEYARAQSGERDVEDADLAAIAEDVVADLRGTIADTRAQVAVESLPTVRGERALLRQLLLNLLGNALKYTRPGEPPEVRVTAERVEGSRWQIAVADRGIGIPPDQAEQAFAMFTRLPSGAAYPGTGMGLALCLKVVERHDGRIWIAPTPGGGTTVLFTLPG